MFPELTELWREAGGTWWGFTRYMLRRLVTFRVPATPMSVFVIRALGTYAIIQGVWMTVGGVERWSGPSYTVVRELPYSPASWGIGLVVSGLIIMIGSLTRRWKTKAVGLGLAAVWSFCFGVGAVWATGTVPTAGTTGGPAYFLHFLFALAVWFVDEASPARALD